MSLSGRIRVAPITKYSCLHSSGSIFPGLAARVAFTLPVKPIMLAFLALLTIFSLLSVLTPQLPRSPGTALTAAADAPLTVLSSSSLRPHELLGRGSPASPLSLSALVTPAPVTLGSDCLSWTLISSPNPGTIANRLSGVAAHSSSDAWAVGYYVDGGVLSPLTLHWDGVSWSDVLPGPGGSGSGVLDAVAIISSDDVWAVGHEGPLYRERTLVEHWNGVEWSIVASPNVEAANFLTGLSAIATNDIWAVGYMEDSQGSTVETLTMHWDGKSWTHIPSPSIGNLTYLRGVAAVSSADVWAVGESYITGGQVTTFILHWDGTKWEQTASPNPDSALNSLFSVAALSADDVWAVGFQGLYNSIQRTLVLHWDGTDWNIIDSPNVTKENRLYGVAAASANDIWAVGAYGPHYSEQAFALHWNGTDWVLESTPSVGTPHNRLHNVASIPAIPGILGRGEGTVWAVGYSEIPTQPPGHALIEQYTGPVERNFTDVEPDDYFAEGVRYLSCKGVVTGYFDNTFRPYNNTTRAQLSKILVLAENWPIYIPPGPTFTDVPQENPFYIYIETAHYHGVISGYSDNTFHPNDDVTRGQASKMVVLARGWQIDVEGGPHFADVPEEHVFYRYVETAYNHQVMSGYDDHTFRPAANATRGQVAKVVVKAMTQSTRAKPNITATRGKVTRP